MKEKYLGFVLILSHTLFVLLVLNFFAWVWIENYKEQQDFSQIYEIFNYEALKSDIPACQLDSNELVDMFDSFITFKASGQQEFLYHPATEYQLNQFSIRELEILAHPSGFNIRSNGLDETAKEKKYQIFCFGGSTTYGSLTKDHQTWPAFLEAQLDSVDVLNFGVPGFVPSQETNQFIYLMKLGYRPDLVIFMDGVNIGPPYDGSDFTRQIAQKFNFQEEADFLESLALVKMWNGNYKEEIDFFMEDVDMIPLGQTDSFNNLVVERFIQNAIIRQTISEIYGVKILQFLQPNGYKDYPIFFANEFTKKYFDNEGALLQKNNLSIIYAQVLEANVGYSDLSFLIKEYNRAPFIDLVHYTPSFNDYISKYLIGTFTIEHGDSSRLNVTGMSYYSF